MYELDRRISRDLPFEVRTGFCVLAQLVNGEGCLLHGPPQALLPVPSLPKRNASSIEC